MINKAMYIQKNEYNEFTLLLQKICDSYLNTEQNVVVQMRNGQFVKVQFKPSEDALTESMFHSDNWDYCWNLDGSSVTCNDFDLVKMETNCNE